MRSSFLNKTVYNFWANCEACLRSARRTGDWTYWCSVAERELCSLGTRPVKVKLFRWERGVCSLYVKPTRGLPHTTRHHRPILTKDEWWAPHNNTLHTVLACVCVCVCSWQLSSGAARSHSHHHNFSPSDSVEAFVFFRVTNLSDVDALTRPTSLMGDSRTKTDYNRAQSIPLPSSQKSDPRMINFS